MSIVQIFATAPRLIVGEIIEQTEAYTSVKYKKPRSSKYAVASYPADQIVFVIPGDDGENNGEIMVIDRHVVYTFEGELESVDGAMVVNGADYVMTLAPGTDVEVSADADEEEAPAKGKKADKKADKPAKGGKSGKGKAAADDEGDDEGDEGEGDEGGEEEAPAKSKKDKKGDKADKGGKKDKGAKEGKKGKKGAEADDEAW